MVETTDLCRIFNWDFQLGFYYSQPSFILTTFIRKFMSPSEHSEQIFQSPDQILKALMFIGSHTANIQMSENSFKISDQDLDSLKTGLSLNENKNCYVSWPPLTHEGRVPPLPWPQEVRINESLLFPPP